MKRNGLLRLTPAFALLGLLGWFPSFNVYGALCMSDTELREVLIGIHTRFLGTLLGTCARRFPHDTEKSMDLAMKFQKTYAENIHANDRATTAAFERAYPGLGEDMRDRNSISALQNAQKELESWSEEQCGKGITGVEATVVAADWQIAVGLPATLAFKQERMRIPVCQ